MASVCTAMSCRDKPSTISIEVRLESITSLLRCLLYRPLSTIPDNLASGRDRSDHAFLLLNSKRLAQPRRLRRAGIDPLGAQTVTNEPAYRMHEMGTESARVMLFPLFA
jgi:hypothetical protein